MTDVNLKMLKDTDGNAFVPFSTTDAVFKDGTNQTVSDLLDGKQATLVSGTNIKTINGDSILGAGNIAVSAEDEIAISTTEPTGNEILWIDPNEDLDAAAQILDGLPVGAECVYWGSTLPDTLLKEDGSQYDVDAYPELFEVIGHTFDLPGDNDNTKFRVPKHDGLTGVGINTSDTDFDTLGETGGSKELQAHTHGTFGNVNEGSASGYGFNAPVVGNPSFGQVAPTTEAGTGNSGNLQPYIVKQYCIKARSNSVNISEVKRATTTSDNDVYSCNYVNDHFGGEVLYNSDTGTTGNVTLSKSASNYSYLLVYWKTTYNALRDGVSIAHNSSINWSIFSIDIDVNNPNGVYIACARYDISGSTITFEVSNINGSSSTSSSGFTITKVIGYK